MIIVEKIAENLRDIPSLEQYHLERVYLEPEHLLKRILRVKTDHGTELGINLEDGQKLHDGDILLKDKSRVIAIFVNSTKVIKINPKDIHDMGYIAHQLGNRHLPAQFTGNSMYVEYDYLVERLLNQLNIPYDVLDEKMSEPFRHIKIEGGHGEANHDVKKDMNKDADKLEHNHEHSHKDYVHIHEHDPMSEEHSHEEHSHEHEHENYEHKHNHDVTTEHSHHEHTHEHEHNEYAHEHEHDSSQDKEHSHKEHSHEHTHDGQTHTHSHPEKDSEHSHKHK